MNAKFVMNKVKNQSQKQIKLHRNTSELGENVSDVLSLAFQVLTLKKWPCCVTCRSWGGKHHVNSCSIYIIGANFRHTQKLS